MLTFPHILYVSIDLQMSNSKLYKIIDLNILEILVVQISQKDKLNYNKIYTIGAIWKC